MTNSKILALVTEAYGGRGGIAQYNQDLLTALSAKFQIKVLPRFAPDATTNLPANLTNLEAVHGRIHYSHRALTLALSYKPDVIFCGHLFMVPLARFVANLVNARLIVQMHGIEAWARPNQLYRRTLEAADLILCVSRYTRAQVISWARISPEKLVVLPNTFGDEFTPGDKTVARRKLDLGDECLLVSVSRLSSSERYKGQDRIIRVIPNLLARGHDIIYLIAGEGDDRPRLEALAKEYGVADRVRFLHSVSKCTLPDLYRAADLFVLPSTGEGFGIVFLEAMASGTRALGLSAGGAVDALCGGELGLAVNEHELEASLHVALNRKRDDPELLAKAVGMRFGRMKFDERARALTACLIAS